MFAKAQLRVMLAIASFLFGVLCCFFVIGHDSTTACCFVGLSVELTLFRCQSNTHWNSSITISGFDPSRSGGPQVPAPLEVNTCIFPIRLRPYTNCR